MCKVSVIVPVYNVEKYLSRSLDSIISQTYTNIEIICINDGSTDNSANILEHYKKLDDRIIIYNTKHNSAAASRNFGIDKANGEYIMFVDSDDYISSVMVEKMLKYITETNADIVISDYCSLNFRKDLSPAKYTHYRQKDDIPNTCEIIEIDKKENYNYLCFTVTCWNKIYSTEFLKSQKLKFPNYPIFEDLIFWADVYLNAEKIYYTPQPFYYYRKRRKGSLMAKRDEYVFWVVPLHQDVAELFKKHNKYDDMKNILDYIMIRDFCVKIFLLEQPYKEQLFNIVKKYNPDINYEELEKLELKDETRQYIKYYKILSESNFDDFCKKTEGHVPIDA